ncbi:hypothetical protein V6N13_144079 [Hibiscus sabdariffa]|uniref:Uncharacterized protein n=1 Tax=Hibiscus sabdariffa TaxID=183260 RepID=A0ABR2FJ96_9ROSI
MSNLSFPTRHSLIGRLHLIKKPLHLHRTLAKLSKQHGPILFFQFGCLPVLVVSSPSTAEELMFHQKTMFGFTNRARLLAGGNTLVTVTRVFPGPCMVTLKKLEACGHSRALVIQSYMFKSILRYECEVLSLILRLCRRPKGGEFQVVEMKSMCFEFTLNVMAKEWKNCRKKAREVAGARDGKEWVHAVAILDLQEEVSRGELGSWQWV